MRFKVILESDKPISIYINYQYYLACSIYHKMSAGDPEFTRELHDRGMNFSQEDCLRYKYFTFSNLQVSNYSIQNKMIESDSNRISFIFSTYDINVAEVFFSGFNHTDTMRILNMEFRTKSIIPLEDITTEGTEYFRTISPIFIRKASFSDQYKYDAHLSPLDSSYSSCIHKNLSNKFNTFAGKRIEFEPTIITCIGLPKQKIIKIKENSPTMMSLKCFLYNFKIQGDPRLIQIGYDCGFGTSNQMGFGCVERLDITQINNESRNHVSIG